MSQYRQIPDVSAQWLVKTFAALILTSCYLIIVGMLLFMSQTFEWLFIWAGSV